MKQNDFLDLCKFVLALMVVAIHAGLCVPIGRWNILWPWLRLAVPLFFLMSSYFFFCRYNSAEDKRAVLTKWLSRNGKLYWFWFVALLPVSLYLRYESWIGQGVLCGMINFCHSLFFGSTFVASWFIVALVLAVLIAIIARRYTGKLGVMIVGLVGFGWSVLTSAYGVEPKFITPYNSFPAAIVWVALGLVFAEGWAFSRTLAKVLLVFSAVLLWVEWDWRSSIDGYYKCDCYFSLLPLVVSLFSLIKDAKFSLAFARTFRSLSVVMFCLHGSMVVLIRRPIHKVCGIADENGICLFVCTVVFCFGAYVILSWLGGRKRLAFFKMAV